MTGRDGPELSVVVPVRNEVGNIAPVIAETETVLGQGGSYELIYVDDGSTDGTGAEIERLRADRPWLRHLSHPVTCGKAAAVRTGVRVARAPVIVTMDGDGQNDPAAIPLMAARLADGGPRCGLVAAQRRRREDTRSKRWQSRIANAVRSRALRDGTRDTNCGLKCFPRAVYLDLPFFDGLHRFLPALVRRDGFTVELIDVVERPRLSGASNYGFLDRLWVGIADLAGVHWLIRRRTRVPAALELPSRAG